MIKKILGVILLVGVGYSIGQFIVFPSDFFTSEKAAETTVTANEELTQTKQDENVKALDVVDEQQSEPPIGPNDVLIPATDEEIAYGLWVGLFDSNGASQATQKLPKKFAETAQFTFVNSVNDKSVLLVIGPFKTEQLAQLAQSELSNSHSINTSLIKYPEVKKKNDG